MVSDGALLVFLGSCSLIPSAFCFVASSSTWGGRSGGSTLTAACIRRTALKTLPFLKTLQYKTYYGLLSWGAIFGSPPLPELLGCVYQCRSLFSQGADALERATRVKIVIFDKTGTLTKGKPTVTNSRVFLKGKLLCTLPSSPKLMGFP